MHGYDDAMLHGLVMGNVTLLISARWLVPGPQLGPHSQLEYLARWRWMDGCFGGASSLRDTNMHARGTWSRLDPVDTPIAYNYAW